jgi:hypothetical protein
MEQPSPGNEILSSISLVNVDDFRTNCQEMTTRTRRSSEKNCIQTTVEKSLIAFAPNNPRRASGSNLGALAIIMNFSTLVYNILFFTTSLRRRHY